MAAAAASLRFEAVRVSALYRLRRALVVSDCLLIVYMYTLGSSSGPVSDCLLIVYLYNVDLLLTVEAAMIGFVAL